MHAATWIVDTRAVGGNLSQKNSYKPSATWIMDTGTVGGNISQKHSYEPSRMPVRERDPFCESKEKGNFARLFPRKVAYHP